ncbi:MAG: hypothetical protein LBU00_04120 [Treponema sp.]|nr:hypothetical protein [Treponema sp.]
MMTAEEAAAAAKGLTFEKVWAMFQETEKRIEQRSQETDKRIKELSQNIGGLNNSFGKWAEELISTKLWEKFEDLGYAFTQGGPYEYREDGQPVAQVDMLLENGEYLMAVEIKSVLTEGHIDKHLQRLVKVRERLDRKNDGRKLLGAVAGMAVSAGVREYAHERGLYVVLQSGDAVVVAKPPEGFKAREW